MTHALTTAQILIRLHNRLNELGAWRDARRQTLMGGEFFAHSSDQAQSIAVGEGWPGRDFPVTLRFETTVPTDWTGPVFLRFDVGGEGLLSVNGQQIGGLNPYHHEYRLAGVCGGQSLSIEIQASPKDLFGRPNLHPQLKVACLVEPDLEVRALHDDLSTAHEAARQLLAHGQPDLAAQLADALSELFTQLPIQRSDSAVYLSRAVQQREQADQIAGIWDEWDFASDDSPPFPDDLCPALRQARQVWGERLADLLKRFPPTGYISLSGHAHIDLAWLWPLSETRLKAQRTFSTVLTLMEQYPDFTFNQSSAQLYGYVEEDAPELFGRIQQRVQEGRWDVVGGMWVEPDGNLISGESWARQLLYGQRYFAEKFGKAARVCWLPDTFGYAANLPQLLRLSNIPYFFTTKLTWNETNTFPYDLYHWEGLDGSRVLAHSFYNPLPAEGYNGDIAPLDTLQTWQNFRGKRQSHASLLSFGHGDGGGGPTAQMLEDYGRIKEFPGLPRLKMTRVAEFYDEVKATNLPTWSGEQYLEMHRGTFTSQAHMKNFNRRLEHTLMETEAACTLGHRLLGQPYPRQDLATLWQTLLRNQFHDILPGSSVKAVYDVAHQELGAALEKATAVRNAALQALSDAVSGPERLVIWNLSSDDRPLHAAFESGRPLTLATEEGLPVQTHFQGGQLHLHAEMTVPGLGYLALKVGQGEAPASAMNTNPHDLTLDNDCLRVTVGGDGTLTSIYDKRLAREMLAGRGNQVWAYVDIAREYDAWEVDAAYAEDGEELLAAQPPQRLSDAPYPAIQVIRKHGNSTITQVYELRPGSARLDIKTEVDWHGRHTFLRSLTPVNIRSPHATYETAYGSVVRTTHTNTSWDAAQFEVPAHRWADLNDGACGVSLLNDSKYGYSCRGNVLGLSLLRSPVYPDPTADEGQHQFTYALYPHAGDWRGGTLREAQDLNAPLIALHSAATGGTLPVRSRLMSLPAGLRLSALKLAEASDDAVLRVYEAHGQQATLDGLSALDVHQWQTVNLLEEVVSDSAKAEEGIRPYQVVTLISGG
ncbi:glycoside hydrolase family 38 C-terminal domain-containing protein [Deinococcus sp. AJ005]|uniref:alpha-mannosidase n=1 Tax=Deinococcus sp. AJ005 TaxID=2652443 RepID=UPI00125CBFA7|nr:glycoside hydrolase family 38 C-terminal domain-containing protein [Deinococcus sp. AJ005]QFP75690.1 alpha-mannosidase [Deinococcus sp. AJ005]